MGAGGTVSGAGDGGIGLGLGGNASAGGGVFWGGQQGGNVGGFASAGGFIVVLAFPGIPTRHPGTVIILRPECLAGLVRVSLLRVPIPLTN